MDIREFGSTEFADEFPGAVQGYLRLQSLSEVVASSDAIGATRLLTCAPFEAFEALTLTFLDGEVEASHVVSDAEAWERIACGEDSAEYMRFVTREHKFGIAELSAVMQNWKKMTEAIEQDESSMADNPEGISYFHLAYGEGVDSLRMWFNPTGEAGSMLAQLLEGYRQIKASLPAD